MGMSVSQICRVRSGKRNINETFIIGALNAFPQFSFGELFYLGQEFDGLVTEEALRESEERYRAIFEQAADSVVLFDVETGAFVEFNDKAHQNLGYSREEFRKLRIPDFEVIESAEEVAKHIEKIVKEGADTFETRQRTKGGEIRDIQVSARAVSVSGRRFIQSIWRDITEHKRAEEAIRESEERFRTLTERASEGISVVGAEGTILYESPSIERILGYRPEDRVGKQPFESLHPDDVSEAAKAYQFLIDNPDEIVTMVIRSRHKDSSWRWMECVGGNLLEDARVHGLVINYRDITERKRAEEEFRRHARWEEALHAVAGTVSQTLNLEEMLDSVVEKMKEAMEADVATISLIDEVAGESILKAHRGLSEEFVASVGRMKLEKEEIERILGWEEQVVANDVILNQANIYKLTAASLKEGLESSLAVRISARRVYLGSVSVAWRNPREFSDEDEELLTAIANQIAVGIQNARLFSDVKTHEDELERAYEDIKAAQEYLVRTERQKALAEMAGGVAHDFSNVLSIVLGRAQLALEGVKEPKVKESLQIIEQSAQDAAKMVRRLQEFAGMTVGEKLEALDLNQVINSALQMVETRRAESQLRGVEIDISADLGEVSTVEGNPGELREVLVNIIFNAMDALPQGGRITVKTAQEDSWVVVSISDTGIGMTEEVKKRIFDPFFTTKGSRGSGLGLSASHGIISKHGGSIEVDSTPGKGSTFYIRIPIFNGTRVKARRD